jgi:hypothetical protein
MAYTVIINIDHANHSFQFCEELWARIADAMTVAGFHHDGRSFSINLPENEARQLARDTMEQLNHELEHHQHHIHRYLTDFYGYDPAYVTNFLLPPQDTMEIQEE